MTSEIFVFPPGSSWEGFDPPAPLERRSTKTTPDGSAVLRIRYQDGTELEMVWAADGVIMFYSNREWVKDPTTNRYQVKPP
jgi:hypothetical protein